MTCRLPFTLPDFWPFRVASQQKPSRTTSAPVQLRLPQSACHISVDLVSGDAAGLLQTCRCFRNLLPCKITAKAATRGWAANIVSLVVLIKWIKRHAESKTGACCDIKQTLYFTSGGLQSNAGTRSLSRPLLLGETDGFVPANEQSRQRTVFTGPVRVKVFLCIKHQTHLQMSLSRAAFNVCILQTLQAVHKWSKAKRAAWAKNVIKEYWFDPSVYISRLFFMASWDCQ